MPTAGSQFNPGAGPVENKLRVLDEVAGPKTSNRKRFFGFLGVLGLGMAVLEIARYLYLRQAIHGLMAATWLAVAVGWGYRYRHFSASQGTRAEGKVSK
jgi:hypothetical protein